MSQDRMLKWLVDRISDGSNNTARSLIDECGSAIEKGHMFERLFDLVIKFGCCDRFESEQFIHKTGNVNRGFFTDVIDLERYIKDRKLFSGKSGGASDITLYNPEQDKWIFTSCKYQRVCDDENCLCKEGNECVSIKKSAYTIEDFDIHKIVAVVDDMRHI